MQKPHTASLHVWGLRVNMVTMGCVHVYELIWMRLSEVMSVNLISMRFSDLFPSGSKQEPLARRVSLDVYLTKPARLWQDVKRISLITPPHSKTPGTNPIRESTRKTVTIKRHFKIKSLDWQWQQCIQQERKISFSELFFNFYDQYRGRGDYRICVGHISFWNTVFYMLCAPLYTFCKCNRLHKYSTICVVQVTNKWLKEGKSFNESF